MAQSFKKGQISEAKLPRDATLAAAIALFIINMVLFQNAESMGNYFDMERFYIFYIILPAVLTLIVVSIAQKWIPWRWLWAGNLAFTTVMLFIFGALSMQFERFNADNLMYIFGYLMIYENETYFAVVAGSLSLLYLSLLSQINVYRQIHASKSLLLEDILKDFGYGAFMALIILYIAGNLSLGIALLLFGGVLGCCGVLAKLSPPVAPDSLFLSPQDLITLSTKSIPLMKLEKMFIPLALLTFGLIVGYLWPIDYVKYGYLGLEPGKTLYYTMNKRQILGESLIALAGFVITLAVIFPLLKKGLVKIASAKDSEPILMAIMLGLTTSLILMLHLGIKMWDIRFSSVMLPWIAASALLWISFLLTRVWDHSRIAVGFFIAIGGLAFWGGLCLGVGADDGYSMPIILGIFSVSVILLGLPYILLGARQVKVANSSQTPTDKPQTPPETEIKSTQPATPSEPPILNLQKTHRIVLVGILAALIIAPTVIVFYNVSAPNGFPILANVDGRCIFYYADPMTRIDRNFRPNFGLSTYNNVDNRVFLSAARNEYQSFQLVMLPINGEHFSLYNIGFTGFTHSVDGSLINSSNFVAYINEYVEPLSNVIADRLVPFYPMSTAEGINQPFWLTFYIPSNASAGEYLGKLNLSVDNQTNPYDWYETEKVEIELRLTVFGFTLPDTASLKSNFGLWTTPYFDSLITEFQRHRMMRWAFFEMPNCTVDASGHVTFINTTKMVETFDEVHAYGTHTIGFHFSPYYLFRSETFTVNGVLYDWQNYSQASTYDQTFQEYFILLETELKSHTFLDYFGRNVSWFDEAYMNSRDEVQAAPEAEKQKVLAEHAWLKNTIGMTLPIMQTMMGEDPEPSIQANIDIICIHTSGAEPQFITDWKAAGKEVWIYTTRGPRFPSPSISTGGFATQLRALPWQCWIYDYTHYLIWDVITPSNADGGYGYQGWNGGSMFYTDQGGYALSTRLEVIRDGFEDYDYFTILQKTLEYFQAADSASPYIAQCQSLLERVDALMVGETPDMDYRVINTLRNEIGVFLTDSGLW